MSEIIMWSVTLVAFLTYIFPPVYLSTKPWAAVLKIVLSATIGGICGYNISGAILSLI